MNAIRIGTRESKLAMWQATQVASLLEDKGFPTEIITIKSEGDIDLITPLYQMGVQGVFTKTLDAAMLSGKIDLAVHSMKDVPVVLAQGLLQSAVLKRGLHSDTLITRGGDVDTMLLQPTTIGTGSLRRKAQWLHRYPHHTVENLRGNVQTRVAKLEHSAWGGVILASAGIERMNMTHIHTHLLDWMIPAPAQGAIVIVCRDGDHRHIEISQLLNDPDTELCTSIERAFLHILEGGCSAPVGAIASIEDEQIHFRGCVTSIDGSEHIAIDTHSDINNQDIAATVASEIKAMGADKILNDIRNATKL